MIKTAFCLTSCKGTKKSGNHILLKQKKRAILARLIYQIRISSGLSRKF